MLLLDLEDISRDGWHLESGATFHMTGECDLFQPSGSIAIRCLVRCEIHIEEVIRREGSVVIELESGWTLAFHHVIYVTLISANVLLVSSLEDQGYTTEFGGLSVYLQENGAMYVEKSIILGIR